MHKKLQAQTTSLMKVPEHMDANCVNFFGKRVAFTTISLTQKGKKPDKFQKIVLIDSDCTATDF